MYSVDNDLSHIWEKTKHLWKELDGKTIFLTGGTGFFGVWLLQSFVYAQTQTRLTARMIILTRSKEKFFSKYPVFSTAESMSFIEGDICGFAFPEEKIDVIIHAATEASAKLNIESPLEMFNTIVNGTKHVLDLAAEKKVSSFLYVSSGAVYGKQPSSEKNIKEDYNGGPDINSPDGVYGEGKRMAEMLCAVYHKHKNIPIRIARCYAFVGPLLPLDTHFAAGNFIKNLLDNQNIRIGGDGTPYRSYMYPADLVIWLWTIALKGTINRPYNVGSDEEVSIEELAKKVLQHDASGQLTVTVALPKENKPALRYVPSVDRAKEELGLELWIGLDEAIARTIRYYSRPVEDAAVS